MKKIMSVLTMAALCFSLSVGLSSCKQIPKELVENLEIQISNIEAITFAYPDSDVSVTTTDPKNFEFLKSYKYERTLSFNEFGETDEDLFVIVRIDLKDEENAATMDVLKDGKIVCTIFPEEAITSEMYIFKANENVVTEDFIKGIDNEKPPLGSEEWERSQGHR